MLKISNFRKKYGDFVAVDNINLEIKKGEIFGFIGPNGAGKTTTIKAIVGIDSIQKGEIFINGISVNKKTFEAKKIISYVQDDPNIYEFLTGKEYLCFIANIFNVNNEKRDELIEKYTKLFGIDKVLNNLTSTYSHGMKQKLCIVSALIHEPQVLILDEPFVGLDPQSYKTFKDIMAEFCKNGGSIFLSSHVLEVVEKICDRVAIINKGKILKTGTVNQIIEDGNLEEKFLKLVKDE